MKKLVLLLLSALLAFGCTACAAKPYTPAGPETGDPALDEAILALLQELCDPKADLVANLGAVYDFLCTGITYRATLTDTSSGFTPELTNALALELLQKRKGNCDAQAALTAVLLRRMGCEAQIVQGMFLRADDPVPVEHAWVRAVVNGTDCWFDPLYGGHFAANPRDYFMADDARMALTHQWNTTAD